VSGNQRRGKAKNQKFYKFFRKRRGVGRGEGDFEKENGVRPEKKKGEHHGDRWGALSYLVAIVQVTGGGIEQDLM